MEGVCEAMLLMAIAGGGGGGVTTMSTRCRPDSMMRRVAGIIQKEREEG